MSKTKELINVVKQIKELEEKDKALRQELLQELPDNYSEEIDGYIIKKREKKITTTDPEILKQAGISLERVLVHKQKIDPALVKRIAEQEKITSVFTTKTEIVVEKINELI